MLQLLEPEISAVERLDRAVWSSWGSQPLDIASFRKITVTRLSERYALAAVTHLYHPDPMYPLQEHWFAVDLEEKKVMQVNGSYDRIVGFTGQVVAAYQDGVRLEAESFGFPYLQKCNLVTGETWIEPYYLQMGQLYDEILMGGLSAPAVVISEISCDKDSIAIAFSAADETEFHGGGVFPRAAVTSASERLLTIRVQADCTADTQSLLQCLEQHPFVASAEIVKYQDSSRQTYTEIALSFSQEGLAFTCSYQDGNGEIPSLVIEIRQR